MKLLKTVLIVTLLATLPSFSGPVKIDTSEVKSFGAFYVKADSNVFNNWYSIKPNDSLTVRAYLENQRRIYKRDISKGLFVLGIAGTVFIFGETMACGDSQSGQRMCDRPNVWPILLGINLITVGSLVEGFYLNRIGKKETDSERALKRRYRKAHSPFAAP